MKPDKPEATQGVPRETPTRNTLKELKRALSVVLTEMSAGAAIDRIVGSGYFEQSLTKQVETTVDVLAEESAGDSLIKALFDSENDRIRSLGVLLHFRHFKGDLAKSLASLRYTGALPGTWTQETSQSTLKNLVHEHGLARVLSEVALWARDPDPNVRRLVVEALRPRGVWCRHISALKADPEPIKPVLEATLDDKSEYVRKAVANSLNDISKDNPELLCKWISNWKKGIISTERKWIIERALRTLVKQNHTTAMKLLGLSDNAKVKAVWKRGTPGEIEIGQSIPFEISISMVGKGTSKLRLQLLMVQPGRGRAPRTARYLLGTIAVSGGETVRVKKSIKFAHKNFVSKIPGVYTLEVQCNGTTVGRRTMTYCGRDLR